MKYYIDFEFIEGFHKPMFGKKRHFIDMISVGVYCEDGRSYYAISNEYRYKDASHWVRDNVIIPIYQNTVSGDARNHFDASNFHRYFGSSNQTIVQNLLEFFGCWRDVAFFRAPEGIEVYGYFCDYDWVLFCSLFGRMIDLPKGFPMYCIDLKQSLDESALSMKEIDIKWQVFNLVDSEYIKGDDIPNSKISIEDKDLKYRLALIKSHSDYPILKNEHNALSDAKWNYDLHQFLKNNFQ